MPEYHVAISITTDDPAHIILKNLNSFLNYYYSALVLNIKQYEEENDDPPYPNNTTYPPNYPDSYPGHPL